MPVSEPHTLLLVEDHAASQALFAYKLREEGFTVLTANGSEEALQICKQHPGPLDLLIVDVFLPRTPELQILKTATRKPSGVNGLELVQQIRFKRPEARVLLISGHSDEMLRTLRIQWEPWPLLRKPFNAATLVEAARQVLAK